jgi:hypothetical protein
MWPSAAEEYDPKGGFLHRRLPNLLVGEVQLPGRTRSFGPQETCEIRVSTKSKVTQGQLQAGDDPPQEVDALVGFKLTGVAPAQEQAVQPHLPSLVTALSLEGMIELAAGLPLGVLGGGLSTEGHKEYLPYR